MQQVEQLAQGARGAGDLAQQRLQVGSGSWSGCRRSGPAPPSSAAPRPRLPGLTGGGPAPVSSAPQRLQVARAQLRRERGQVGQDCRTRARPQVRGRRRTLHRRRPGRITAGQAVDQRVGACGELAADDAQLAGRRARSPTAWRSSGEVASSRNATRVASASAASGAAVAELGQSRSSVASIASKRVRQPRDLGPGPSPRPAGASGASRGRPPGSPRAGSGGELRRSRRATSAAHLARGTPPYRGAGRRPRVSPAGYRRRPDVELTLRAVEGEVISRTVPTRRPRMVTGAPVVSPCTSPAKRTRKRSPGPPPPGRSSAPSSGARRSAAERLAPQIPGPPEKPSAASRSLCIASSNASAVPTCG